MVKQRTYRPRAFYCTKMCEKSKSTTFSYYKTEDLQARSGQSSFNIYVWVTRHLRADQMPDKFCQSL